MKSKASFQYQTDFLTQKLLGFVSLGMFALVFLIFIFLWVEILDFKGVVPWTSFYTDINWSPTSGKFGLFKLFVGTFLVAGLSLAIVTPLGLFSALFLNVFSPKAVAKVYRKILELLGAIPSVIYGFWGLLVLVPIVDKFQSPGASLLTAVLVLSLMILPTTALMLDASFRMIPKNLIRNARSLGIGPWGQMRLVYWPKSKGSMLTAALLSLGRATGETMAVMMVCGNIIQIPGGVFDPIRTLTANIALQLGYAEGFHRNSLFVSGMLLLVIITILVAAIAWVEVRHSEAQYS